MSDATERQVVFNSERRTTPKDREGIMNTTADTLAADIRAVDGNHSLGADALADALAERGWQKVENARISEDGYILDEYDHEWGHCNACGEEAERDRECCDDGEVVPDDE